MRAGGVPQHQWWCERNRARHHRPDTPIRAVDNIDVVAGHRQRGTHDAVDGADLARLACDRDAQAIGRAASLCPANDALWLREPLAIDGGAGARRRLLEDGEVAVAGSG